DATLAYTEEVAGAAQSQVFLGEAETIVGVLEDFQALLGLHAGIRAENVAVGLMLAAPDAPTKLVQLREAKAVGVFDYHDRRVRYVDADFYHRGSNQDIQFAITELAHHRVFIRRLHTAVQQAQAQMGKDIAAQAFVFRRRRLDRQGFGFLDQRADDEGLPALLYLLCDQLVGLISARAGAPACD